MFLKKIEALTGDTYFFRACPGGVILWKCEKNGVQKPVLGFSSIPDSIPFLKAWIAVLSKNK